MEKDRAVHFHFHFLPSLAHMGFFPFIFSILLSFCVIVSCSVISSNFVLYPNYTASGVHFIDGSLGFLSSPNGTFKAAILSPGGQGGSGSNYYLCIVHVPSNTVTWSANRNAPVSSVGAMTLSGTGIVLTDHGILVWSTPRLHSPAWSLHLTETGNLVLLNQSNAILWESFRFPTDTIVMGQELPIGVLLSSAVSTTDLSVGDYSLSITANDALLQWRNLTYWKLSMDTAAYSISSNQVEYLAIDQTGLYLFSTNGSEVVIQVNLSIPNFAIAKLDYSGQFSVSSLTGTTFKTVFAGPENKCQIPFICGKLGLCTDAADNAVCSCPPNFHANSQSLSPTVCVPTDASYSLSSSCNSTNTGNSSFSYLSLGYGIDYFTTDFTRPAKYAVTLSICEDLCSSECSCLGIFYDNSSNSCYVLENQLGSLISSVSSSSIDRSGYVKVIVGPLPANSSPTSGQGLGFPIVALVLLPSIGFFLLAILGFFLYRRSRSSKVGKLHINSQTSTCSSEDLDAFSIPGLPVRFAYEELEVATDKFKTVIGSGGFGTVYKGTLPDESLVAVKKITNFGTRGMKDFCTEIAIIGNIHHVNLVKLRGFCAQGRERLLVYEYMNLGSLDRTLFGNGAVLEWKERVEIALGTARGLAYLHSGCQHKIIHCDVKPENILLHDHFQAKISDFGLSKLLNSEQSGLFTTMRGTRGYLAPEWLTSTAISDKTDVYSFGMVLLEIVSGRKNCSLQMRSESLEDEISSGQSSPSSSRKGLVYFPMFALEMHEQGRYLELADPRLKGRVTSEDVEKLVCVALCCAHEDPALRPSMVSIVSMLEGEIPFGQPRPESLNFLRFYGRRFAEASTAQRNNGQDDFIFPQLNASITSSRISLPVNFSYISSQQVSGPR